jgi:serine/threonine protein kinase
LEIFKELNEDFINFDKSYTLKEIATNLHKLGSGTYGTVYRGILKIEDADRKDSGDCAIKVIKRMSEFNNLFREMKLLRKLEDKCSGLFTCFHKIYFGKETPEDEPSFLIQTMELIKGKELADVQTTLLGHERLKIFKDICEGVKIMHSHNIVHKDLKPANIMISPELKTTIIDFGFSCENVPGRFQCTDPMSTVVFSTPELLVYFKKYFAGNLSNEESKEMLEVMKPNDVFACAVIMYDVMEDDIPRNTKLEWTERKIMKFYKNPPPKFKNPANPKLKELILEVLMTPQKIE